MSSISCAFSHCCAPAKPAHRANWSPASKISCGFAPVSWRGHRNLHSSTFLRSGVLHNRQCRTQHRVAFARFSVTPSSVVTSAKSPHENMRPDMISPSLNLKAVLFDLDGTCVNSDHIHYETYRDTILELVPSFNNGVPITRQYYDTSMSGRQNPDLVASILPDMSLAERTTLWQTKERRYEDIIMKGIPPLAGLLTLLKFCKECGLTTFVVTNAPKGSCKKTMESIGIRDHFGSQVVVAEECARPKPHPAPYLKALTLAGVSPHEAIVFEDSTSGIQSATTAGILTIGVRSTQSDEVLRTAGASFTIQDYTAKELVEALTSWVKK